MLHEPIRVLIVDGAMQRHEHVADMLTADGFATRVVSDSGSAAGALEIWRPAVAIVDLRHPASDARHFCATLAERSEDGPAVVLIAEGPNLLKPLPIVPDGLVSTPIDPDLLVATVRRVSRATIGAGAGSAATGGR